MVFMSRKGPKVGQGMLDFMEDLRFDGKIVWKKRYELKVFDSLRD